MADTRLQQLAAEARRNMIQDTRTSNDAKFWKVKDGAPDWIGIMCRDCHGTMFPDDWKYAFVVESLDALEDTDDPDEIQLEADIYNHELTAWLGSHGHRPGYCDEAAEEFGFEVSNGNGIIDLIGLGQLAEKNEVLGSVRQYLEEMVSEQEEIELAEEENETDYEDA